MSFLARPIFGYLSVSLTHFVLHMLSVCFILWTHRDRLVAQQKNRHREKSFHLLHHSPMPTVLEKATTSELLI